MSVFAWLDEHGGGPVTAEVELRLGNGALMTVLAGGPGVRSSPPGPPFSTYEVLVDHEPPRFWNRYTDDVGMLFAFVPRLLVAHHVIRHGGIDEASFRYSRRTEQVFLGLRMSLPATAKALVFNAIAAIPGVTILSPIETGSGVLPEEQ